MGLGHRSALQCFSWKFGRNFLQLLPDLLGELSVGDQEGGDAVLVQQPHEAVDLWVHDGLPHQGQGTVLHRQGFLQASCLHS